MEYILLFFILVSLYLSSKCLHRVDATELTIDLLVLDTLIKDYERSGNNTLEYEFTIVKARQRFRERARRLKVPEEQINSILGEDP